MICDRLDSRAILTCGEAAASGLYRFYTGRTCRAGHDSERFVSNRQCVTCNGLSARRWEAARGRQDPSYRMYRNTQRRTGMALSGRASPADALGCDHPTLRQHIERLFKPGMTWANYRQWEVDHVQPLCGAKDLGELLKRCHYSNLQPLWRRENLAKGGA